MIRFLPFWILLLAAAAPVLVVFGVPGIGFWLCVVVVAAMALTRVYQARREALLRLLAFAADRQMPLPPLVRAFAEESQSKRLARVARQLEAGEPLSAALERTGNPLGRDATVAAIGGEQSGALSVALADAVRTRRSRAALWTTYGEQFIYIGMIMLVVTSILTFYMIKIIPAFSKIFDDFQLELPTMTLQLIQFCKFMVAGPATPLMLLILLVMFLLVLRYIGWLHFRVPLLGRLTDRLDSAVVLRALAIGVERKQPLPVLLQAIIAAYPNRVVRFRMDQARRDMSDGRDWIDALQSNGLIRAAEAGLLHSAERVGNLPWAMREAAHGIERRLGYRLKAATQIIFPLMVLMLGMLIAFVAIALFLPLVKLITVLT